MLFFLLFFSNSDKNLCAVCKQHNKLHRLAFFELVKFDSFSGKAKKSTLYLLQFEELMTIGAGKMSP